MSVLKPNSTGLVPASLAVAILVTSPPAFSAVDTSALQAARSRIASLKSIHLHARATVTLHAPLRGPAFASPRQGSGEYEYWESGTLYRALARTDPALGLASDFEVGFDGRRFRAWDAKARVLQVSSRDVRQDMPLAMPNPLFTYFFHLSFSPAECRGCALRLSDLRNEPRMRQRFGTMRVDESPNGETARFPGWSSADQPGSSFEFRVRFEDGPGGPRVARIEGVSPSGGVLWFFEFSRFQTVNSARGPVEIPREVRHVGFVPGTETVSSEARFDIDVLEVDVPFDEKTFALDESSAPQIWDEDTHRFLKPCRACSDRQP